MTAEDTNGPDQLSSVVRRYTRVRTQTKYYTPSMKGNRYAYAAANMAEQEVLHPDDHVFFSHIEVHNEPYLTAVIMTQLSLKSSEEEKSTQRRISFILGTNFYL